ncbi:hypothetical protein [Desulfogranum marinum]|uniref:hypothetical protein n=1 Tax=Desulfogranum marinum TaxID=453220 RepID=UPI001964F766|nr:hypothetical protein [Desulfogranum marinum]MBM9512929.1 hypothetical protein [Desulfogranum marinum]
MEPISSTVGAGLIAYASKDLVAKLLGPSAEYVGGEIKGLVDKCNINIGDIFNKAGRKAAGTLDDGSQVNPRVVKSVISEGSFCDDDTLKEYYAGILAASRTQDGTDDVGVSILGVLKSLSVYQVRLHYIFYREFHRLYSTNPARLGDVSERNKRKLYIPINTLISALKPGRDLESLITHTVTGLVKHDLLGTTWQFGMPEHLKKIYVKATQPGIILEPTLSGVELFAWANGKQNISPTKFLESSPLDPDFNFSIIPGTEPIHQNT